MTTKLAGMLLVESKHKNEQQQQYTQLDRPSVGTDGLLCNHKRGDRGQPGDRDDLHEQVRRPLDQWSVTQLPEVYHR